MPIWAQILLALVLAAAGGFAGNFGYSLFWALLKRKFGWEESHLIAKTFKYAARVVPELIVLAVAATVFGWWIPIGAWFVGLTPANPPVTTAPQFNNDLYFTRIDVHPYEAGKSAAINIHYRYEGENPARMSGPVKITVIQLPEAYLDSISMIEELEEQYWNELKKISPPPSSIVLRPKGNSWTTLWGPILTQEQAQELNTKSSGILMAMGAFFWNDGTGDYETDFCGFTQGASPTVFIHCRNHNGPVTNKKTQLRPTTPPSMAPIQVQPAPTIASSEPIEPSKKVNCPPGGFAHNEFHIDAHNTGLGPNIVITGDNYCDNLWDLHTKGGPTVIDPENKIYPAPPAPH
jgi:hypothetical protein